MIFSVGVNEYVILNHSHIKDHGLATQGLAGCVILAALEGQKCLLAHLSNETSFNGTTLQTDCLDMALMKFESPKFFIVSKGTPFSSVCNNGRRVKNYLAFMQKGCAVKCIKGNGMIIESNKKNPPVWNQETYGGFKAWKDWGNTTNAEKKHAVVGTLMLDKNVMKSSAKGESE